MIKVIQPDADKLNEVLAWPTWQKESSKFDHDYTEREEFYIVEGKAVLSTDSGIEQEINVGDLVSVEQGILVHWDIQEPVKKHFKFFK